MCFRQGPEGAHQVRNDTDEPVRVLIASTKADPALAVYPDSGKIGIWPGNEADPPLVRRESAVDYWDGEDAAKSRPCASPIAEGLRAAYVAVVGRRFAGSSPFRATDLAEGVLAGQRLPTTSVCTSCVPS